LENPCANILDAFVRGRKNSFARKRIPLSIYLERKNQEHLQQGLARKRIEYRKSSCLQATYQILQIETS
jgi:hypothetical protein